MKADHTKLQGKHALITVASSGLGIEFARQLAHHGSHLTLVARHEEPMQNLKKELVKNYSIDIDIIPMDLTQLHAAELLYSKVHANKKQVNILINNAGYGLYGEFKNLEWDQQKNMLELDILALTHLTHIFLKDMIEQKNGYILQVSSVGAYQAVPTYATYAAAKSFVLRFGEALHYELRHTGVSCTVLSSGITKANFLNVLDQKLTNYQKMIIMGSSTVVAIGIKAMLKGKSNVIPGWLNAFIAWSTRFVPRRLSTAMAYAFMKSD